MKIKIRVFITLILAGIFVLSLIACGGEETATPPISIATPQDTDRSSLLLSEAIDNLDHSTLKLYERVNKLLFELFSMLGDIQQTTVTTAGTDRVWDVLYQLDSVMGSPKLAELKLFEKGGSGARLFGIIFKIDSRTVVSTNAFFFECSMEEIRTSLPCYLQSANDKGRRIESQGIINQLFAHKSY